MTLISADKKLRQEGDEGARSPHGKGRTQIAYQKLTVELSGGLANQLFQWAAGYVMAQQYDLELQLDCRIVSRPDGRGYQLEPLVPATHLLRASDWETSFWLWAHSSLPGKAVGLIKRMRRATFQLGSKRASSYAAARALLSKRSGSVRLTGLFQEVDQVIESRQLIVSALTVPILPASLDAGEYSAVHIRRGDYVQNEKYARIFGSCSRAYYLLAINTIPDHERVVFASDDILWAEKLGRDTGRSGVELSPARDHFEDFSVLVHARRLVLSNSTFSWWAAFLSTAGEVIAPDPWFSDRSRDRGLILDGWVRMPRDGNSVP